MKKKWLLLNPPSGAYIRDARCQSPINGAFATSERPPVDLGYIAGILTANNADVIIKDCEIEGITLNEVQLLIREKEIDYLVINTLMFTFREDLKICSYAKNVNPDICTIVKGSIRYDYPEECFHNQKDMDILVLHCEEVVFEQLSKGEKLSEIPNIIYRHKNKIIKNRVEYTNELKLPLPRFDLIKHKLYRRPDTNEVQATIVVSRGCNGRCIYCIAPIVNGNRVVYRQIDEIIHEINTYYYQYQISNFYFSADNFVHNKSWVLEFCKKCQELPYDIHWLCTSRIDCVDEEMIVQMYKAGCYGVSIGIESGNQEIQKHIGKNLDLKQVSTKIKMYKKNGIICLTHFIIGFPWDTNETIKETINLAQKVKGNIIEFYIATPLPGTKFYEMIQKKSHFAQMRNTYHIDYDTSCIGTYELSAKEVHRWRMRAIRKIYTNPFFYIRSIKFIKGWRQLLCCINFFSKKIVSIIFRGHKKYGKNKFEETDCKL